VAKPKLQTLKSRLQELRPKLPVLGSTSWRSGLTSSSARGYDYSWQKRRAAQLKREPLCAYCLRAGKTVTATVADHITPHRGDPELFKGPLQSLCATCHSSAKAREEGRGVPRVGCDAEGWPTPPGGRM
jgi:5-methylcytosine-specific restriction enzyme A